MLLFSCANEEGSDSDPLESDSLSVQGVSTTGEIDTPRIEVVFVLDATGSMSGLIQTAKDKIWSFASTMSDADPKPIFKMGMVFYRDRGDEFITQRIQMTEELDFVYGPLMDMSANGGGDSPESVNQGLFEAITQTHWSESDSVYKVVFLIGDCPPHMDYRNDTKYQETCKLANEKGVVINTVQLGDCSGTKPIWEEIASLTGGEYLLLRQDAQGVNISTPYDVQINQLSGDLEKTKVYYGGNAYLEKIETKKEMATYVVSGSSVASSTRRTLFNASDAGKRNFYGEHELINAVMEGRVSKDSVLRIPKNQLPEELREMDDNELWADVSKKVLTRRTTLKKIKDLSDKRVEFLDKEMEGTDLEGETFSDKVYDVIKDQTNSKGIKVSDKVKH